MTATFKSGDQVRVAGHLNPWGGHHGEVFKVDSSDPAMTYKVILDNGFSSWFASDELEHVDD